MRIRPIFITALLSATAAASIGAATPTQSPKSPRVAPQRHIVAQPTGAQPNVIVILVDDLGWPDVSTYGRAEVPTPNIDRLARTGVAFSSGYVTASVCAVSRAGLLTGRRPAEIGFTYNITDRGNADAGAGLPVGQATMADRLRAVGYRTAAFGKWHQGAERQFYPTNRGFDEFFGFLSGETIYVDPKTPGIVTTPTKSDRYPIDKREGNAQIVEGPEAKAVDNFDKYLTTEITDRAVDYIGRNHKTGRPFFAYLAYNAPHWPLQVPQRYYDRFNNIKDPVRRTYIAMISALDDGVGRIIDTLDATGQRDNTLIVFLSDNGCPEQFGFCATDHPWSAGKFTYLEGGTRVPFVVSWPKGIKARGVIDTPVTSLDILPTALRAAAPGRPLPKDLDGDDLVALLKDGGRTTRTLLWGQEPVFAVRQGRYKLWRSNDWNQTYLYDLTTDPGERKDLSAAKPKVRATLEKHMNEWRGTLPPPLWPLHQTRKVMINGRETQWVY
ncbi:sulfatase-like hydrolase/transferase [Sphingobium sp. DEHP117]|uniref:sulfatase-like hydrolase/transferase n=1 Tax=Sphingobium sp. DEHP117 TaxID=2993436 RepID=UPI0027D6F717|nr:sulfatase-like hydrolase/transferase [Sphingobium sp. DEHP117]MDQ4421537.1 sulfatase-like hydrolase/transferase [Sphingobium sp. DEHP117]